MSYPTTLNQNVNMELVEIIQFNTILNLFVGIIICLFFEKLSEDSHFVPLCPKTSIITVGMVRANSSPS